jgi:hypothetical protein
MTANVTAEQRHTRQRRCPVCDGADGDVRGKRKRCSGFTSADGGYVHCSREELAGAIAANGAGLFAHRMQGACHCGTTHGAITQTTGTSTIEATYPYTDEAGSLLFQVVRKAGKHFRQRKPDGVGGWEWKLNGVRRVPYRLRELVEASADRTVYIVEGEKDVEALEQRGHLATTNPGGAGKWSAVASVAAAALQGREVLIVADRDDVGRQHALEIEASLRRVTSSVRIVEPQLPHKDVSDVLLAGGTLDDLVPLAIAVQPNAAAAGLVSEPPPAVAAPDAKAERFKVWSPEEIWAPLPPAIYTVGGLLRRANLALLVAYGSSFKTWEMIDLAIAQATGTTFLGRFECPTPGPTLIVDWESGDEELRRRLQAVSKARGFVGAVPGVEFVTMPDLFFTSADFEREITRLSQGRTLIAFDSLAAGSVDVDENDARFAKGLQILKRVATLTGCSMLVLHHARKSNGEANDERELVRGSGAIFAAADAVLVLVKQDDDAFLCKHIKSRGGKKVEPFVVRVEDVADGGVRVYASEAEEVGDARSYERGSSIERAKARVLSLIGTSRDVRSVNEIHRRLGGRKKTVGDAVAELEERGTLSRRDGTFCLSSEVR